MLTVDKWDKRFLELCDHIAKWSHDPSTKVGAVVVNDKKIIIGMGYNGFPRGIDDAPVIYANRPLKHKMVIHAEVNAILNANAPVAGHTLYTSLFTCNDCAKIIIQSGIKKIVSYHPHVNSGWSESFELSKKMYNQVGIEVVLYDR